MRKFIFTDLACEMDELQGFFSKSATINITDNIRKTRICIEAGEYITFYCSQLWNIEDKEHFALSEAIAAEVKNILFNSFDMLNKKDISLLVVGLGNPLLTPDALGAETVKNIIVTRHLPKKLYGKIAVSAIVPNVGGNTGIDTVEVLRSYVNGVRPDAVILIDSLAARSMERLAATVQLSTVGISPGSGIGEGRGELSKSSLGVPVISLGVPTVINSATLISEVVGDNYNIDEGIFQSAQMYFVTPKEIDIIIKYSALLIADALNTAFGLS